MNSVKDVLDGAATYACYKGYNSISVHLLAAATLQSSEVSSLLSEWNIDDRNVFHEILDTYEADRRDHAEEANGPLRLTEEAKFVYKLAEELAKSLSMEASPLFLLAAFVEARSGDGHLEISRILQRHNIDCDEVYETVASRHLETSARRKAPEKVAEAPVRPIAVDEFPNISKFTTDLLAKARDGKIDPIIGRKHEVDRTIRILCRRRKNNPVLIGEPGVGKTSIAEELARRIAAGEVPPRLQSKILVSLDLGGLVGGTKWRGELEERVKGLIDEIQRHGNIVLFIDEIHMLTGRMLDGCSDLFKPALANGELTAIGATTQSEYLMYFEKDAAMARRFQPVIVGEPDVHAAVTMIKSVLPTFARHHNIGFDPAVAEYAVEMAIRHIPRQMLPDKAIDLIDEAAAGAVSKAHKMVTCAHIEDVIKDMVGASAVKKTVPDMIKEMKRDVPGTEQMFRELEYFLKVHEAGLSNGEVRGTASVIALPGSASDRFIKSLANAMGTALLVIDGSEYQHENAVWRLVGSPPGYKDHEKGGHLTESLRRNPMTLIAVERIDEASSDVQSLVKSLIVEGKINDSAQRTVSASEVAVVILRQQDEAKSFGFSITDGAVKKYYDEFSEMVDVEIELPKPSCEELGAEFDRLFETLQIKAKRSGLEFAPDEHLKVEIIRDCMHAENPFQELNKQFAVRVKRQLILGNFKGSCGTGGKLEKAA